MISFYTLYKFGKSVLNFIQKTAEAALCYFVPILVQSAWSDFFFEVELYKGVKTELNTNFNSGFAMFSLLWNQTTMTKQSVYFTVCHALLLDVWKDCSRLGLGWGSISTFFSLIGIGNVEHGPKPDLFIYSFIYLFIFYIIAQFVAQQKRVLPVDKVSSVWKYFELECESSQAATCNIHNTTTELRGNN